MASGQSLQQQANSLHSRLKSLINNDLKEICRSEELPVSGVKSVLQQRIIQYLSHLAHRGDENAVARIRYRILNHGATPPATPHPPQLPDYPDSVSPINPATMQNPYRSVSAVNLPSRPRYQPRFSFKQSPFYDVEEALAPTVELQVLPNNRTSTTISVQLPADICDRFKSSTSTRAMLFSAADPVLAHYAAADIAFPHQLEVKINGDEVRSNFKGLKNKPGSTRPADITEFLRKIPGYNNNIQITYALTQKASKERKFHMVVYLARKHSVSELAGRINRIFTKDKVMDEMRARAQDPDIVIESQIVSLRDPVAGIRIAMPCRSTVCSHNECFDAMSFLQLQEQAPTWICPICSKTVSYEALAVDRYMQDILAKTTSSTDQARIYPDGTWSPGTADKMKNQHTTPSSEASGVRGPPDDSDDDLVEISAPPIMKKEESTTPLHSVNTPPVSSREPSTTSAVPGSNRGKRKQEVIDLTLSDDDEPPRPAKRTNSAYSTPNSLPDRFRQPSMAHNAYPSHPPAPVTPSHYHHDQSANRPPSSLGPPMASRPRHSVNGNYNTPQTHNYYDDQQWYNSSRTR
ncbi:miz zinc finger protein [Diplodia corticola]|uniref:Miz zinc finger protein n=1 Tax=Diplodia corticola TaxID=236234 RepID=A0A1J9QTB9_9PEZI|nr:miz zinc finger protein [Diplodia corticola]OJD31649.1 miz zinc finger protein [Diplodia corticola]